MPFTLLALLYSSGVHKQAGTREGLKEQLVPTYLCDHESTVGIKTGRFEIGLAKPPRAQLARRSLDKVSDALLRFCAFVNVIMTREDHVHAILDENRFENFSQF